MPVLVSAGPWPISATGHSATLNPGSGGASPYRLPLRFLNRCSHFVTPLGPRSIVIFHILESKQLSQNKPGVTRSFSNPAVNDGVFRWFEAEIVDVDFPELVHWFECPILPGRSFPRNALCGRNVSTTQNSLLRILWHMGNVSLEFTRRTHVDQRLACLALRQGLFVKRTDLIVRSSGRNRVLGWSILRHFSRQFPFFGHPLVPASIHDSQVFVPKKRKHP